MNTVLDITPQHIEANQSRLIVLVGQNEISYATTVTDENSVTAVGIFSFTKDFSIADEMNLFVKSHPVLKQSFKNTLIYFTFSDCLLIPRQYSGNINSGEILEFVFGTKEALVLQDDNSRNEFVNIYRVDESLYNLIPGLFPGADIFHLYSRLPLIFKENEGAHIHTIFNPNSFIALLSVNGKMTVTQQFEYKTPEDVVYYLLSLCKNFGADVSETTIHINGLLNTDSALYKEMYKYIRHIVFDMLPENIRFSDEIKEHPMQYFSHLYLMATCE